MKPEVYKKAAKLILEHRFSCLALEEAIASEMIIDSRIYIDIYECYFKPEKVTRDVPWFDYHEDGSQDSEFLHLPTLNRRLARELSLLFMAEIAKEEICSK